MRDFPKTHLWMILPLFIALAGFYFSYWSKFSQIPFHQHLHGLTATLWYGLLVLQPWLYKQNNIQLHRQFGFVGIFLAGGVVFSALQVVPNNLLNERLEPVLRYGLTWADFIFLAGFSHAVIMAMLNSRQMEIHARYMIASVFWALLPALVRLIYFPLVIIYGYPPPFSFIEILYFSAGLVIAVIVIMMIVDYKKKGKVYTSYGLVVGGTLIFATSFEMVGEALWWIDFCDSVFGIV